MDVHPANQPLHTWKDFWIHLGTITAGLLIALGLEAGVERMHQLHQRHQLEEALRAEAVKNIDILDRNIKVVDRYMGWLAGLQRELVRARGRQDKHASVYPQ